MRSIIVMTVLALGLVANVAPAEASGVRLFVQHEVADYAAWRKFYEGFTPAQKKGGVTAQAVYQSVDDPNNVIVTHDFKTPEAAKAFVGSADLKAAMEKAGVKGAPQIWITRATPGGSGKASKVRSIVRHDVVDYAAWRKVYDEYAPVKRGATAHAVYQSIDDPNNLTVTHDYASAESAKAFFGSADLKAAMQKGGVKGTPQIWIVTRAKK